MSIDDEWNSFMMTGDSEVIDNINNKAVDESTIIPELTAPACEELYISTTTKVLFLNQPIDIANIFWKLPIIDYGTPSDGIVKKQMKIVCNSEEEFNIYTERISNIQYYRENIVKQLNNPTARRIKYKDERKITVGMSKKDIMNCRGKVKNAFYNCFAIILRFKFEDNFREIHIKVFNTGKLEIPGILNLTILDMVKTQLLDYLTPYIDTPIEYVKTTNDCNVLINSNFNCGYYINRDKLYSILRSNKYCIETAYDPCSYPGVKCKFYFNNETGFDIITQRGQLVKEDRTMKMNELGDAKKYTEVSFMIFRTGSCLIVGNCTEEKLYFVYEFIKKMLYEEYPLIYVHNEIVQTKEKKTKLRKKKVIMTREYYNDNIIS
jgi:hypothetical protein